MESPIDGKQTNQSIKVKDKFEGKVIRTSLQGAILDISSTLPAFLHISQVVDPNNPDADVKNLEDVLKVGESVTVWVRRVMKDHCEVTMHEPLAYEWRELVPDMVLHGKVIRLETFGAFVEVGAERPGLVHVSEMSHNYIKTPAEVVKVGDEVDVKVLEVDKRKKQIKLSIKALQDPPAVVEDEVVPVRKPSRKSGNAPSGKPRKQETYIFDDDDDSVPDPTYMELALRQAMDRAEKRLPEITTRVKKNKSYDREADDMYDRTIKGRHMDKE